MGDLELLILLSLPVKCQKLQVCGTVFSFVVVMIKSYDGLVEPSKKTTFSVLPHNFITTF